MTAIVKYFNKRIIGLSPIFLHSLLIYNVFNHSSFYKIKSLDKITRTMYMKNLLISQCKNKSYEPNRSDKNIIPAKWRMPLLIIWLLELEKFSATKSEHLAQQRNPRGTWRGATSLVCCVCYLIKAHSLSRQPPPAPPPRRLDNFAQQKQKTSLIKREIKSCC